MTNQATSERTWTVSWVDPALGMAAAPTLTGLEYLQAMARGELPGPPILSLMRMRAAEVAAGRVTFEAEPGEQHYNPMGTVHGGFAATVFDSAMTCAVLSQLPAGVVCTTLEFKVNFVRPITAETGTVRCVGEAIHVGSQTATAEGRLYDRYERLLGHATTTCLILRRPNAG